jgi:hypothetical protein
VQGDKIYLGNQRDQILLDVLIAKKHHVWLGIKIFRGFAQVKKMLPMV